MPEITSNVKFENIAREWRCKWSADNDKASLTAAQEQLEEILADVSSLDGLASVQRVVCGGCLDFKVIISFKAAAFGEWEKKAFAPEAEFVKALGAIAGITSVETQTYTMEEVKLSKKQIQSKVQAKAQKAAAAAEKGDKVVKELTPEELEKAKKDKIKKAVKEGGKRGVEIEGAADMGGLQFFSTSVDVPEGDVEILMMEVKAMNAKSDPTEEERKGGSGHVGKMVFSAGNHQLAMVAYVPEEKQGNPGDGDKVQCEEWLAKVMSLYQGKMLETGKDYCSGIIPTDGDKNIFPLKIRDSLILEANNFLRKKGLFPEDDSDDDEMVFGDDDFPS